MTDDLTQTKAIVELIQQATSLQVVSAFLKSKGLRYSAGRWDAMLNDRLIPAVTAGLLSNEDLINLLRSVEECGRQHVFLFACPKALAVELIDRTRVEKVAKKMELQNLLMTPKTLTKPTNPELVDIRWDTAKVDLALTIKEIELRTYQKYVRTKLFGNELHKIYSRVEERAVNLVKLHRSGLLEIRIAAHSNSTKYDGDLRRFWHHIAPFFLERDFTELSLLTAKERLWAERSILSQAIRYTDSTIRNENGNLLRGATGGLSNDLVSDLAVSQSLDYLLEHDSNAYCDGANIWFKEAEGLSTDVHVLLGGEVNEFALPASCTAEDYQYVLDQLRSLNRRVS